MITVRRTRELLQRFRHQRILVAGDLMLDRYLYGSVERISPEAPVPVVRVAQEKQMPGGAANVAANLCALGGSALLSGVVGTDAAGHALLATLQESGVGTSGVVRAPGTVTIVKMRIIADRQQVVRVDWETSSALAESVRREMIRRAAVLTSRATGVVLADYGKGVVEQDLVNAVLASARRRGIPVGVDPKDTHALVLRGIAVATPNCREAHVCAGLTPRASVPGNPRRDALLNEAARRLLDRWQPQQLLITLGAQGMYLAAPGAAPELIPTRAREVFDVSGAGDTVIATCLLALAAGANRREAAALGNYAAGVVVGKLGTASCHPEELIEAVGRDAPGGRGTPRKGVRTR